MSKIIDERPLLVLPALAVQVGLNESIFIQQLHFWLTWLADAIEKRQIKVEDRWEQDRIWIRNTNHQWREQFPFWSIPTIKRTISSSKQFGVLVVQSNDDRWDKTNLYSLDYSVLRKLNIYALDQIDPIERIRLISSTGSTRPDRMDQIDPNIIQRHNKDTSTKQPSEAGKEGAHAKRSRLSFANDYGIGWPIGLARYIGEADAAEICRVHKLSSDQARRVLAELSAEALRGFRKSPEAALHHLCRAAAGTAKKPLGHSAAGDENLPGWA